MMETKHGKRGQRVTI